MPPSCARISTAPAHEKKRRTSDRPVARRTDHQNSCVDALGNPVDVMLTPGQTHDLACAEPLLEGVDPEALIGDKAYDAAPLRGTLAQREITPVISPKANRKTPPP